ncbi:MAG: DUF1566 domain-containing protein [Deltaproteobacteria bacterium]|nr:DUF1566 domain-containing protein [Deltaproteobacteria bacterium]
MSTAVWRDPRTGLTWQTGDAGQDMYWTSAKEYCAGLALGGGNWRLPTIEELKGLVRKEQPGPPFIVAALKATTTSEQFRFYWSATAYPAGSDSVAEVIDFSSGKTYGDMRQGHRVRCVR